MRGRSDRLKAIADRLLALRGVKQGGIEIVAGSGTWVTITATSATCRGNGAVTTLPRAGQRGGHVEEWPARGAPSADRSAYSWDRENRTGTTTSLVTASSEARAGSKVQVRTASMAAWSSSGWPLLLASETRSTRPSGLTVTVNRPRPLHASACTRRDTRDGDCSDSAASARTVIGPGCFGAGAGGAWYSRNLERPRPWAAVVRGQREARPRWRSPPRLTD
jgi:hypothetical protein